MTERELRERVAWTVEDAPAQVRLVGLLAAALSTVATVATLGTTTGARSTPTWQLPPNAHVDGGPTGVPAKACALGSR